MKKRVQLLRNKYFATTLVFILYGLFLDDVDIFSILRQNNKLKSLTRAKNETSIKLKQTKETIEKLKSHSELERFAREKKLFKKDNEDVFVISYE